MNGRLSLYLKTNIGFNIPQLYHYLKLASKEDVIDTFIIAFHLRDCRGGKGYRKLGIKALQWLFLSYPKQFMRVAHLIPTYGRWDDLLHFWPGVLNLETAISNPNEIKQKQWRNLLNKNFCVTIKSEKELKLLQEFQKELISIMGKQLKKDHMKMSTSENVSLCAKWAPTENDSMDKNYNTVKNLCNVMSINKASYRKIYTSPLRNYLKVTETLICRKDWEKINFDNVPYLAMKNLKKVFEKHTPQTWYKWKNKSFSKRKKRSQQTLPHDIISVIAVKGRSDIVCQSKWEEIEEYARTTGVFSHTLIIVDVSMSMKEWKNSKKYNFTFTPLDISIGFGILAAASNSMRGDFSNSIVTFSNRPSFVKLSSKDLYERYLTLKNSNWAGKIDLTVIFSLILEKSQNKLLVAKDIPKRLLIISDMDFKKAGCTNVDFCSIDLQYKNAGYSRPTIVFWNICSDVFSISLHSSGTIIISGFYPCVVESILAGEDNLNYGSIIRKILDDNKYRIIRSTLEGK